MLPTLPYRSGAYSSPALRSQQGQNGSPTADLPKMGIGTTYAYSQRLRCQLVGLLNRREVTFPPYTLMCSDAPQRYPSFTSRRFHANVGPRSLATT